MKYYYFLVFCIIICQCKNPSPLPIQEKIQVDFSPKNNIPDSIISHIDYIPLETSTESLIGEINKILIKDNRIYILDSRYTQSLFVFDTLGRFIFKIHRIGKGPGEYIVLRDFAIHEKYIILLGYRSALFFNLSGEYLFTRNFEWMAENICIKSDEEVYLFQNSHLTKDRFVPFHIVKTDIKFRKSSEYLKSIRKEISNYYRFQQYGNSILMTSPQQYLNRVLNVTDKNNSLFITYDFGNYNIPERFINCPIVLTNEEQYPIIKYSIIQENIIYFLFSYQHYLYIGLHFKNGQITYTGKVINNVPLSTPVIYYISNDKLYTYCHSVNIIEKYNLMGENINYNSNYKYEYLSDLVEKNYLTEESNPVIICYTINNTINWDSHFQKKVFLNNK